MAMQKFLIRFNLALPYSIVVLFAPFYGSEIRDTG